MNLGIGSHVKHKLVVSGLNNNDKSCLCKSMSIIIKLTRAFLFKINAETGKIKIKQEMNYTLLLACFKVHAVICIQGKSYDVTSLS